MTKSDRLMPVITLTVYWGKEAWDGAKSLYEMLDIPPVLSQYKDIINISVLGNARELDHYLENRKECREVLDMCEALQEMIMDGKVEGKAESVLELLGELGDISEDLRAKIMAQKDLDTLKIWLKLAARADTVEEFVCKMA